jgi:hypothetical protein
MALSWLFLVGTAGVLWLEHVRALGRTPRAAALFLPQVWMLFTGRQYENLLWGWMSNACE